MEESKEMKQFMSDVSSLFGKLFSVNYSLLKKSDDHSKEFTISEVFDFYISSHGESFLRSFYYLLIESKGMFLNARCILEGIALKKMNETGDMPENALDLLKNQDGLIEMKQYKKFAEIASNVMFPNDMKSNYELSENKYYEILKDKFSKSEIDKIIKSNIPFLCNPKIHYIDLVRKYLGEQAATYYSLLSSIIHPNANDPINIEFCMSIFTWIYSLLDDMYGTTEPIINLESYMLMTASGNDAKAYLRNINEECEALKEIEKYFKKEFGENYVSDTVHSISILMNEIAIDKINGLSEQSKCKYKALIEIIASFYNIYCLDENVDKKYILMKMHQNANNSKTLGEEYNLDEAYKLYLELYPKGVDRENFEKAFMTTTGYSMNEKGQCQKLTAMVNTVCELLSRNDGKLSYCETAKIDYVESQMLSHANGYMWFSNSGAWNDSNNIFIETNFILHCIFKYIEEIFNDNYKESNKYGDKKIANTLKKAYKIIEKVSSNLFKLQLKPQVHL